ncbi:hypothetical protein WR25_17737 [Diploscapter pachys]|uniref:Uncharacterized protein n=1 Tax=Diploscapter pachys TaxID=2018661 RepID=A0A2A2LPI4_9BILA|nr:hypothetical protein WR25_17737 [Diploscapter pachys]
MSPKRTRKDMKPADSEMTEYETMLRETYPDSALADEIFFADDDNSVTPKRRRRRQDSDSAWTSPQSLRTPVSNGTKPSRLTMSADANRKARGSLTIRTSPIEPFNGTSNQPSSDEQPKRKVGRPRKNPGANGSGNVSAIHSPTQSSSDYSTPQKSDQRSPVKANPASSPKREKPSMNSPDQSERKRRVRISLEEAVRETLAEGVPSLKRPKRNASDKLEVIEKFDREIRSPNRPRRSLAVYKNVPYDESPNGLHSGDSDTEKSDRSSKKFPRRWRKSEESLSPRRSSRLISRPNRRKRSRSAEPVLYRTLWQHVKAEPIWGFGITVDEVFESIDVFECGLRSMDIKIREKPQKKSRVEIKKAHWHRDVDDRNLYQSNLQKHLCNRRNRSSSPVNQSYIVERSSKYKEKKAIKKKRRLTSDEYDNDSIADQSRSTVSPEKCCHEFSDFIMKGLSKGDYRSRMQGVISMYKYMSLRDWRGRTIFTPFLYRNHWIYTAYKDRMVPRDYAIYFEDPPMAYPDRRSGKRRVKQRTDRQKAYRLDSIVEILVDGGRLLRKARKDLNDDEVHFPAGTLVKYKWHGKEALLSDPAYRRKLIRDGAEILPERKYFPDKEPDKRLYKTFSPTKSHQHPVKEDSPVSAVYVHSARIGRIIHNILPGTRNAKVEMYTIKRYGNKTMKPERIGKFEMSVNAKQPDNRVADFMVTEPCDFDLLYTFFIITISPDKSQPELVKKRAIEAETDTVYICGRSVYESEKIRQNTYGFLKGHINMCLILATEIHANKTDWRIMDEIDAKVKKTDGMAFFQIELFTDIIGGTEGSVNANEKEVPVNESPVEKKVDKNSPEVESKGSENGEETRNPPMTLLSAYTGKYKDEKRYVNDYRILEDLFDKDIEAILSGENGEAQALRKYFSFRPQMILYRIFSHLSKKKLNEEDVELDHIMNKRDERIMHPIYDIFLDPYFKDVQETYQMGVVSRRDPEPPQFLITKAESVQLKQTMRMYMALFTTLLTDPSPTMKKRVEQTAFVNPRDGRLLAPYAKAPFDANAIPHTLAEVGHYITSEKIGQFIDISGGAKSFMIMWNTFVNKFGPPRCREVGRYMLTKLFMKFYLDDLRNTDWGLRMLKFHISSDAFYGKINTYDWLDLTHRVKSWDTYDPLDHSGSGIYEALLTCLEAGNKKFKKTMDRHPATDRRSFPMVFRKDVCELKENRKELRNAMEFCLTQNLFPKTRPERLYLADPAEHIFGSDKIPTCFKNWKGM